MLDLMRIPAAWLKPRGACPLVLLLALALACCKYRSESLCLETKTMTLQALASSVVSPRLTHAASIIDIRLFSDSARLAANFGCLQQEAVVPLRAVMLSWKRQSVIITASLQSTVFCCSSPFAFLPFLCVLLSQDPACGCFVWCPDPCLTSTSSRNTEKSAFLLAAETV